MDREEAERVALLAKGAVELGVNLALLPVKLVLRAVRPGHEDTWSPVPYRAATPGTAGAPAAGYAQDGPAAAAPAGSAPAARSARGGQAAPPARSAPVARTARAGRAAESARSARTPPSARGGRATRSATGAPADATARPAATPVRATPRPKPEAPRTPAKPMAPAAATPSPHAGNLTAADAARVREARREAEAPPGSLGAQLHVETPWEGYDSQNVATVVARLRDADAAQRAIVRLYEETHKKRAGILRATAR
jgi:hypothetical protein